MGVPQQCVSDTMLPIRFIISCRGKCPAVNDVRVGVAVFGVGTFAGSVSERSGQSHYYSLHEIHTSLLSYFDFKLNEDTYLRHLRSSADIILRMFRGGIELGFISHCN